MTRIFDIRGTHGSGKSYMIHCLLAHREQHTIADDSGPLGTYLPDLRTAILGLYLNNCGGCDQIKKADEVCRRVRVFAEMKEVDTVLLEGILVAHTFKRYSDLAKEMIRKGHEYTFLFIEADLDTCIQRVRKRRVESGKDPDFDLFHITNDHKRIHQRLPRKFKEQGLKVVQFQSYEQFKRIIT